MSLPTPLTSVEKLQKALPGKAKSAVGCRFYTLWDKVWRWDVLGEAYRRCRANGGSPGVDGQSFAAIESEGGVGSWLAALREELRRKEYRPQPLLRVWIPKASGGQRPLGIPTIRDRVVPMAVWLVIGPIFEADLCDEQYGFRSGVDAKMAVRRAYYHVAERGLREVVDADLSDYFNTIPHGDLMRCVSRRIADGSVLSVVKAWLEAPAVERQERREHRTTAAADSHRGTPQGGVISPLLANLYFRRFVLAWKQFGHERQLQARVVNYADDLVICCRPGNGPAAMAAFRSIITRLGLTVNERKTRLVQRPEESFDFLGDTVGRFSGQAGRTFIGTRIAKKSVIRLKKRIHEETSSRWNWQRPEERVEVLNPILRGWCGYFNQGPVVRVYGAVRRYTESRFRSWLMRRIQRRGRGHHRFPDRYRYEELGLHPFSDPRPAKTNAKA